MEGDPEHPQYNKLFDSSTLPKQTINASINGLFNNSKLSNISYSCGANKEYIDFTYIYQINDNAALYNWFTTDSTRYHTSHGNTINETLFKSSYDNMLVDVYDYNGHTPYTLTVDSYNNIKGTVELNHRMYIKYPIIIATIDKNTGNNNIELQYISNGFGISYIEFTQYQAFDTYIYVYPYNYFNVPKLYEVLQGPDINNNEWKKSNNWRTYGFGQNNSTVNSSTYIQVSSGTSTISLQLNNSAPINTIRLETLLANDCSILDKVLCNVYYIKGDGVSAKRKVRMSIEYKK